MRAIEAKTFSGYDALRQAEYPKPQALAPLTGPSGLDMVVVRTWVCRECGVTHDRDVNSARNIRSAGRSPPSVSGNESPSSVAEPSQTYSRCEVGISAMKTAA
jgi:putative transposase-like DNA-binding protein